MRRSGWSRTTCAPTAPKSSAPADSAMSRCQAPGHGSSGQVAAGIPGVPALDLDERSPAVAILVAIVLARVALRKAVDVDEIGIRPDLAHAADERDVLVPVV